MMDALGTNIASIIVGLLVGYLSQFLQPRSRLLYWSPHNFFFELKNEGVMLMTNSLTLQNVGRVPAEDIEIIHKQRPDFFELYPSAEYQETTQPDGKHIIRIKNIGPKEWVLVQLLSYSHQPVLNNVRWKHGRATLVQIVPQRVVPRWVTVTANSLGLVGAGCIAYFVVRATVYFTQILS